MIRPLALPLVMVLAFSGCRYGGTPLKSAQAAQSISRSTKNQAAQEGPAPTPSPSPSSSPSPLAGESCVSSDPQQLCIGLRYVVYQDQRGEPISDERAAEENLQGANEIWKRCGIAFQLEKYDVVDPSGLGLAFGGPTGELQSERARAIFAEPDRFVVVTTGPWHAGKNAWTNLPGAAHAGAVIEGSVASGFPEIYAHELGHYLNLDHSGRSGRNVMSELISHASHELSEAQCDEARRSARTHWGPMLRQPGSPTSRSGS